jgi:predicted AlkP superfamily pyrophosphatase or phosphodiesterase
LTSAAYAAYAFADQCLARIVDAAQSAGLKNRVTFIVVSDHGFGNVSHVIRPNLVLAQRGLLKQQGGNYRGTAWFVTEGGEASLYIHDASMRSSLVKDLKGIFSALPGIAGVYNNEEAQKFGIPAAGQTDQAPDLYLNALPSYAFIDDIDGQPVSELTAPNGTHGYLNTDADMEALFIASGAQIRPGVDLGVISNLRVAPTIAKILNVSLPLAVQKPLVEALSH